MKVTKAPPILIIHISLSETGIRPAFCADK